MFQVDSVFLKHKPIFLAEEWRYMFVWEFMTLQKITTTAQDIFTTVIGVSVTEQVSTPSQMPSIPDLFT